MSDIAARASALATVPWLVGCLARGAGTLAGGYFNPFKTQSVRPVFEPAYSTEPLQASYWPSSTGLGPWPPSLCESFTSSPVLTYR